jgi:hypothetical protein
LFNAISFFFLGENDKTTKRYSDPNCPSAS